MIRTGVQVLSHFVAAALDAHAHLKTFGEGEERDLAESTAHFISTMDLLFDTLNSSNKPQVFKIFLQPLS